MAQKWTLTTPLVPPTVTTYEVTQLFMSRTMSVIHVEVTTNTGVVVSYTYTGATALTLLGQLNVANNFTIPLERRILERLATDGVIGPGSVTGTP